MSPSLSDFAMTRQLKQLAGTIYNHSLLELGALLQDIMQSLQMVQMFLLSTSEKSLYNHRIAFAIWKHGPSEVGNTEGKKKKRTKIKSCTSPAAWIPTRLIIHIKVNLNKWNMKTSFTTVFKNVPPSDPFNVHFHYQGVNLKLGFTVVWSDQGCFLLFCSRQWLLAPRWNCGCEIQTSSICQSSWLRIESDGAVSSSSSISNSKLSNLEI